MNHIDRIILNHRIGNGADGARDRGLIVVPALEVELFRLDRRAGGVGINLNPVDRNRKHPV